MKNKNDLINQIKIDLIRDIVSAKAEDLSDIGNTIGIVIGKHLDENEMGFDKDDFLHGIKHGFSLVDGTH